MVTWEKPATQKPNTIKRWLRSHFLSGYLKNISGNGCTLDLACGYGFSFDIIPGLIGLDLDVKSLRFCRNRGYPVIKADIHQPLPFHDAFFNSCFSHDVLEHFEIEQVEVIFKNVHRILRKDGIFMNIIPNKKGYDLGLKTNAGHKHFITVEEIKKIALETGFRFIKTYSSPLPSFFHPVFAHNKYVIICRRF